MLTIKLTRRTFLFFIASTPFFSLNAKQSVPEILLAQVYQSGLDVTQYLVSEKFDGVRATWDGKVLRTRSGKVINSPVWFVKDFPAMPMDGES